MSLEENAVSIYDVYVIVCEYMRQAKPVPNKQVVALENAQKEIAELTTGYEFRLTEFEAKIEAANEKLAEITQNREYQCFAESALIPCKANCARGYEKLCDQITELTVILANQIPRKEESNAQVIPIKADSEAAKRIRRIIEIGKAEENTTL